MRVRIKRWADAHFVDEAKRIRDVADAMRAYAKQAKNRQLEIDAAEIRIRAERRVGELIFRQKAPSANDWLRVGARTWCQGETTLRG